jgi:hypothetical protein
VHKDNKFESVGILRTIPKLLNILRKEGFARVHRQRKGDSLNLSRRLREKQSKIRVECKHCAQEIVIPYYKLK